eukprot:3917025-Amphidinium_carterae.1
MLAIGSTYSVKLVLLRVTSHISEPTLCSNKWRLLKTPFCTQAVSVVVAVDACTQCSVWCEGGRIASRISSVKWVRCQHDNAIIHGDVHDAAVVGTLRDILPVQMCMSAFSSHSHLLFVIVVMVSPFLVFFFPACKRRRVREDSARHARPPIPGTYHQPSDLM